MANDTKLRNDPYAADITKITELGPLLDVIRMSRGWSDTETLYSSLFYGLNNQPGMVPMHPHMEAQGFVFFTRPLLNLNDSNLIKDRKFAQMMSNNDKSIYRVIRAYLDPIGAMSKGQGSPLVDPANPFISILTNTCLSLSGWPDPQVDTYSSTEGLYGEQWIMYDGHLKLRRKTSLNATFHNPQNDPIGFMFNTWIEYGTFVYDDTMQARLEARLQRYIDYQTRIYRIVLDENQQYVTRWATAIACMPTSYTIGSYYDYQNDQYHRNANKEISVSFDCVGIEYNDPICLTEFNQCTWGALRNEADIKKAFTKIPLGDRPYFSRWSYPRVDPETREMQWWIESDIYTAIIKYRDEALK